MFDPPYIVVTLGRSAELQAAFATAAICALLTIVLLRLKISCPCLIGLGFAPLILFSGFYSCLPRPPLPVHIVIQILVLSIFVVPSYSLSFLSSSGFVAYFLLRGQASGLSGRPMCFWFLAIHIVGLLWAYMFVAYR